MSHSTIYRRLQEFAGSHAPFGNLKERSFIWLLVDGTTVHLQGNKGKNLGQAQMRWALASQGEGTPPLSPWAFGSTPRGSTSGKIWPGG